MPWILGYGIFARRRRRGSDRGAMQGILAIVGVAVCAASAVLAASKMAAPRSSSPRRSSLPLGCPPGDPAMGFRSPRRRRWSSSSSRSPPTVRSRSASRISGGALGRCSPRTSAASPGARDCGWERTSCSPGADSELSPRSFRRICRAARAIFGCEMHNDYLELYLAGGVVAVALVLWLAVGYRGPRRTRRPKLESTRGRLLPSLGLVLGLLALAVHELVDFNLQISGQCAPVRRARRPRRVPGGRGGRAGHERRSTSSTSSARDPTS